MMTTTTASMFPESGRCLSAESCHEDDLTTFKVDVFSCYGPPCFENINPFVNIVIVKDVNNEDRQAARCRKSILNKLGRVVKSHNGGGIRTFRFCEGHIDDYCYGALLLAISKGRQPVSIEFDHCTFGYFNNDNVPTRVQYMLEHGRLEAISFQKCRFYRQTRKALQESLIRSSNRRLRKFHCHMRSTTNEDFGGIDTTTVCEMVTTNPNLVDLALFFNQSSDVNDFCQAASVHQTLERLEVRNTSMDMSFMKPLVMICAKINSLRELAFTDCGFSTSSLNHLSEALSANNIIDTLKFENNRFRASPVTVSNFGSLQVKTLQFSKLKFRDNRFGVMLNGIAHNPCIQSFAMYGLCDDHEVEEICTVLLRQNMGPSELIIAKINPEAVGSLIEALQQNASLETLGIGLTDDPSRLAFTRGLATMGGLRKLCIDFRGFYGNPEDFFSVLVQSLEQNTTLCQLSLKHAPCDFPIVEQYLPRIRYLLAINMVGRHRLMVTPPPVGLWARVLANASKEADAIYFALRENPDLISY